MKRLLLNLILLAFGLPNNYAQVNPQDSMALVEIYNATGGANWTNNTNWLQGPVGSWYGIEINQNRVTELQFYNNNLIGSLPESIGDLTGLINLDFGLNQVSGELPSSLGNCSELRFISCYVNELTGTIPISLANTKLESFSGYRNEFSGNFPEVFLQIPALTRLEINSNNFEGTIPVGINNLTKLTLLALSRNNFSGNMPTINNLTALIELHLRENAMLRGNLNEILGYKPNLYFTTLSDCSFSGCLSDTSFNPEVFQFLHVDNNQLDCIGDFNSFISIGPMQRVYCGGNQLTFDDLENNSDITEFLYAPQDSLLTAEIHLLQPGDMLTIQSGTGGIHTNYAWFKDGIKLEGETSNTLTINNFNESDAGTYHAECTNSQLPDLTLYRSTVTLIPENTSSISDLPKQILRTYPNPASDFISFSDLTGKGEVTVYSMDGTLQMNSTVSLDEPLFLQDLKSGLYLLYVKSKGNHFSTKIMIQK